MSDVLYEVHENVATIKTNRPEVRNAQSRKLLEALDDCFAEAEKDTQVHVIVLFGEGDHFSAGHDLGSSQESADRLARPLQQGIRGMYNHSREQYVEKTMRWRNIQKPTVAGVQGYCIFGGWILASAMDIIYAAENAMFLASNFQFFTVPWDVHPRKAKELLFESRFIDAHEAQELGLVNRVMPTHELEQATMEYALRIARNDPFQLQMMKLAVNQMQDTQGFQAHIRAAHLSHVLSAAGEKDEDYALKVPDKKRRPMVEQAFHNYQQRKSDQSNV